MCTYRETFNFPAYNHRYNYSPDMLKERLKDMNFIASKLSVEIVVGQSLW